MININLMTSHCIDITMNLIKNLNFYCLDMIKEIFYDLRWNRIYPIYNIEIKTAPLFG